jgi:diguanylate cyclase (GGDEF)-like protein
MQRLLRRLSFASSNDAISDRSEMQLDVQGNGSKKVTVSIGVATFPQAGQTAEDLVRSADRALYLAKNNGRDRVEKAETMVAG